MGSGKLKVTPSWRRLENGKMAPLEGSEEKMVLELTAPEHGEGGNKVFMDLVVVLDISGSMAGQKIQKMKDTMVELINKWLRPSDHLCIITFDTDARVVFPMYPMYGSCKVAAETVAMGLQADGWTNMQKGLQLAVDEIRSKSDVSNRAAAIILMSDGAQNNGSNAGQVPVERVPVETIGFGTDYEHQILQYISDKSSGGVFNNSLDVNHLARTMSPLLDFRKHIVLTDLVLTLQQAPTMSVAFGTYPQETFQPGIITINAGSLTGGAQQRVTVNFYLPPAYFEGRKETVMKISWRYKRMPGGTMENGNLDIEITRTRAAATPALVIAVPKKIRTKQIRLNHVAVIKDVKWLADQRRFNEAQERLRLARDILYNALRMADYDVCKSAIECLYAEMVDLFKVTESEEKYKNQGGQFYVLACISSHDRQRFVARGDDSCRVRLFTTRRMEQYLDEAIQFDRMSCTA